MPSNKRHRAHSPALLPIKECKRMSEQVEITPEMIAEYNRRQQAQEQVAMQACINDLIALAAERGFVIVAATQQVPDGRTGIISIGAVWGVQRK